MRKGMNGIAGLAILGCVATAWLPPICRAEETVTQPLQDSDLGPLCRVPYSLDGGIVPPGAKCVSAPIGRASSDLAYQDIKPPKPAPSSPSKGPMVSVEPTAVGDELRLRVAWSGLKANSLLVVAIDSRKAAQTRPREVLPDSTQLFGVTLLRSIEAAGEDTLSLESKPLSAFIGDNGAVITALIIARLEIQLLSGDPAVQGALRVREVKNLDSKKVPHSFRLLGRNAQYSALRLRNLDRTVEPLEGNGPAEVPVRYLVSNDDKRASSSVSVSLEKKD